MEDYEAVVLRVASADDIHELSPSGWIHVAGVDRIVELVNIYIGLDIVKLWHIAEQAVEIKRLESTGLRVYAHADSAPRVDEEHLITSF
jgi:predicted metal-dependent phosphotriesterase family hydrolase